MIAHCLAAILYLSPLSPLTAAHYSILIYTTAQKYHVDPLLVVSIIHLETGTTWKTNSKSKTNDYGLMQTHVSSTTNPELLGKEKMLFAPRIGILYGVKSLVMWKNYHRRECEVHTKICYSGPNGPWGCSVEKIAGSNHHYLAHYQWGYIVKSTEWAAAVNQLYHSLKNAVQNNKLLAKVEQ